MSNVFISHEVLLPIIDNHLLSLYKAHLAFRIMKRWKMG